MRMRNQNLIVSPSFLSADFADAQNELDKIVSSGVDYLHLDVMDGAFVPNITFGPKFIKDLRSKTDLVFDVHLMIEQPERYIRDFADAGSDIITIHQEATKHLHRALSLIKECGKECGVAINPATPVEMILPILDMVDYVLIMSVNPGFGGQKFIPSTLRKVEYLASIREREGYHFLINIDGGISEKTIGEAAEAGIDMPVSGSAFFKAQDPSEFVDNLISIAAEANR